MQKILNWIVGMVLILIPLIIISCEEEVVIKLDEQELSRLVVEGRITNKNQQHILRLTRTSSYFQNQEVPPALGLSAKITEKGTGKSFTLSLYDTINGLYKTEPLKGKENETYILSINDGNETYSASALLTHVAEMDSINYEYEYFPRDEVGYYKIRMSALEPNPLGDIYMFRLFVNDTLYTDRINLTPLQDDLLFNNQYLANVEVIYLPQEEIIVDTNVIRLEMYSISEAEYEYSYAYMNQTLNSGSIFSGPPANVPSNLKNLGDGLDALGFFGASALSIKETYLYREHPDSTNNSEYRH